MQTHKSNFIQLIVEDVIQITNDVADEAAAFDRVAANWLGYNLNDDHYVDGARDRGIDFWYASETGFDFVQVKSHRLINGKINLNLMDNSGVNDLKRIIELLLAQTYQEEANRKVQKLLKEWQITVATKGMVEEPEAIEVNIYLVIFSEGLTKQANEELLNFKKQNTSKLLRNVPINIYIHTLTINDLIDNKWRQSNQQWKDKNGASKDYITLTPEVGKADCPQWIPGHTTAIFYCKAIDLVLAFSDFGYQIFEPNVRAHINKSRVNAAIKKSLHHGSSRKQFKYLNNGVTMTCKSFTKPSENKKCFKIIQPGIINGLQTVISLFDAYSELGETEKEHFEENCFVLLRIITENTVKDINKVVLATNTQNPMQARNLRSNNEEQIIFERLFAERNWFFERKQGAWDAYSSDPSRWRTLSTYKKERFKFEYEDGGKRKKYRKVDNEQLAQAWLAFIGFSEEAMHRKRDLFDVDELYQLSFLQRPKKHSFEYSFNRKKLKEESSNEAPEPALMIAAFLAKDYAKLIPISTRQARENAIVKLGIEKNEPKENIDVLINDDPEFLRSRVQNSMALIFVELFGYILFKTFNSNLYSIGNSLLQTDSLKKLHIYGNITNLELIRKGEIESDDILGLAWHAFDHIIDELLGGVWKENFLSAFPRSRFVYTKDTRSRIFRAMDDLDEFMKRTQLTKIWASSIVAGTGFYKNIERIIMGVVN